MIIRELRPTDFDSLTATFYSYFDEVDADPSFGLVLMRVKPSMEEERLWFSGALKDMSEGNLIMMVAESDSQAVGNCVVRRIRPKSSVDHRGDLGIAVRKEFRGKGVGEALLRATLEKCKGKFESIELTVLSDNHRAKRLYERLGFRFYGTRKRAIKRSGRYFDEDLMYLEL